MTRRQRSRTAFRFGIGRAAGKCEALTVGIKRTADLCGDLDLSLHTPARDQGGVELTKDISYRQSHHNTSAILFGCEHLGRRRAQLTEGVLNHSTDQPIEH